MAKNWLDSIRDDGHLSKDQFDEVVTVAKANRLTEEKALIKLAYVDTSVIKKYQAKEVGAEFVELEDIEVPPNIIEKLTESVARENNVIPLRMDGDSLVVALDDAMKFEVIDKLQFILNCEVKVAVATSGDITEAINRHYSQTETESVDSMIQEFTETAIDFTETELSQAETENEEDDSSPIVRLVNLIITEAINMRASDIHIEPFEDRIRIRYRIDGALVERDSPPRRLLAALVSRIKVMSNIDIAEKRRPQDGRIKTRSGSKEFDLRVSILPTNHGQALVLRVLDRDNIKVGIRNLGFSEENYRRFQNIIRRPNGIFLVTGPTGSGKTTTLYSALGELNRPDRKITGLPKSLPPCPGELKGWDDKTVKLSELWSEGPIVLMWYRGGWCPYCNIQLRAMQQNLDKIKNSGARLVVLTPELPEKAKETAEKNNLNIVALHDKDLALAKKYGIVFELPAPILPMYRDKLKLGKYNGNDAMELPLSATYVINKSGKITYAFLDADYKKRAEPKTVVAEVKKAAGK